MFGGLGFMINNKLAVFAHGEGGLWVRCAPARTAELEHRGARPADLGNGHRMGPGWLQVDADTASTPESLEFWIEVALQHNRTSTPKPRP